MELATHSSILAWEIPWTEEPGRLQSMGSQRIGHDWATEYVCTTWLNHRCTGIWHKVLLCVPVRMFLDQIGICAGKVSKGDAFPRWFSSHLLRTWIEQESGGRGNSLSLFLTAWAGHWSSPAFGLWLTPWTLLVLRPPVLDWNLYH